MSIADLPGIELCALWASTYFPTVCKLFYHEVNPLSRTNNHFRKIRVSRFARIVVYSHPLTITPNRRTCYPSGRPEFITRPWEPGRLKPPPQNGLPYLAEANEEGGSP
jgi:hypothetical protein